MKVKKVVVVGASGATGRLLLRELLDRGLNVVAIVRSPEKLPESLRLHEKLTLVHASLLDLSDEAMIRDVEGCEALASCLGHNLSWKGLFGQPRWLVTDATRRLCEAIESKHPTIPCRYVLMNTAGNRNRDLNEAISFGQKLVVGLIRLLLPPHADNEKAADYLRTRIGKEHDAIEWVAVRPDSLIDEHAISDYEVHASPQRSAIFNPGRTSRINVASFMADLITDDDTWVKWKGKMPVIYNQTT